MVSAFGRMSGPAPELALLTFQSIAVGHRFEFHANGVGDGDDGASFEREGRQHRTELMHFERVVTFRQHIPAPITDADDERLDFETGGRFPRAEDLQDSLLCIFVLDGRALWTFVPSDHVLHDFSPLSHFVTICPVAYRDGFKPVTSLASAGFLRSLAESVDRDHSKSTLSASLSALSRESLSLAHTSRDDYREDLAVRFLRFWQFYSWQTW